MVIGTMNIKLWSEAMSLIADRAPQFIDIMDKVQELVQHSGILQGMALIFSRHTTAASRINEHEPELVKDMERFLSQLSPQEAAYFTTISLSALSTWKKTSAPTVTLTASTAARHKRDGADYGRPPYAGGLAADIHGGVGPAPGP